MMPLTQTQSLLVQDLGTEVMILDPTAKKCYCLNNFASMVWRNCDGLHTVEDIAKKLEGEIKSRKEDSHFQSLVNLEVERLKGFQLVEESPKPSEPITLAILQETRENLIGF